MDRDPKTIEEARARTYGPSYRARAYDPSQCCESVWPGGGWGSAQCSRKPGYGPAGLYCKQHAPETKAARAAEQQAKYDAERARTRAAEALRSAERGVIAAAVAATRQTGTWDAVAEAVFALERAQEGRDG
jgi:hypothetical protein